jgi:hypothetical protein
MTNQETSLELLLKEMQDNEINSDNISQLLQQMVHF